MNHYKQIPAIVTSSHFISAYPYQKHPTPWWSNTMAFFGLLWPSLHSLESGVLMEIFLFGQYDTVILVLFCWPLSFYLLSWQTLILSCLYTLSFCLYLSVPFIFPTTAALPHHMYVSTPCRGVWRNEQCACDSLSAAEQKQWHCSRYLNPSEDYRALSISVTFRYSS